MEVVKQKPERRARRQRGQDPGRADVQIESDDRERDAVDRAQPGRQTIDAVGEVDDVHHSHEPEDRQVIARVRELERSYERERQIGHLDSALDREHRRSDLSRQLHGRGQVERVVCRTDQRDQAGASGDPPSVDGPACALERADRSREVDRIRQPDGGRHEDADQNRQATELLQSMRGIPANGAPIRRASLAASGVSTVAMTIATRNANTASQ